MKTAIKSIIEVAMFGLMLTAVTGIIAAVYLTVNMILN
jgi:hypothetical protein